MDNVVPGFENDLIKCWLDQGVFWGEYKEIMLGRKEAERIVKDRIAFQKGIPYPAIADIRKIKYANREATAYMSEKGNELLLCVAIIVDSHISKVLGNFYLKINKPGIPTKLFNHSEAAREWAVAFKI